MRVLFLLALAAASAVDLDKEHPVAKITKLLSDMRTTVQTEQAHDSSINEKMDCWCTTNAKEKDAAVQAAQSAISAATATIEEESANAAARTAEIQGLRDEIAANQQAMQEATQLRNTEREEFEAEAADLSASIASLQGAVDTLGSHHDDFLAVSEHLKKIQHTLKPKAMALLQKPMGNKSYNSRSGAIFGILRQMKEEFEGNLANAQKEEASAQASFERLIAKKEQEIGAAKTRVVSKTEQLTEARVAVAQAKHDLKDARASLSADQAFIVDMEARCASASKEFAERSVQRNEELAGLNDAIKILTSDESRDLFSSTLGFLQLEARQLRSAVVAKLARAAEVSNDRALLQLASNAKLDAFVKVKKAIDDMLAQLKVDQADEVQHQRFCNKEFRKNDVATKEQTWASEDHTKAVNRLADTIETLDADVAQLRANVAEAKRQVKYASEDREAANKEFQQTIADQRATKVVLSKVLDRLQEIYEPEAHAAKHAPPAEPSFLQLRKAGQPEYKGDSDRQSSGGVLGLIRMTIADTERLEQECLAAEQEAQDGYQKLVKDTANAIAADSKAASDKLAAKAQAETDHVASQEALQQADAQLAALSKFRSELHASCDFVVKNFDIRQTARQEEMDALEDAKAILSGSSFQ